MNLYLIAAFLWAAAFFLNAVHAQDEEDYVLENREEIADFERSHSPVNHSASKAVIFPENLVNQYQNLADLLELSPGIDIMRSGDTDSFTTISLRGARSSQLLLVVDGIEYGGFEQPSVNLSNLNISSISKIEVYRSFLPLKYQMKNIGGAVIISTKEGSKNESKTDVNLGIGSFGHVNAILGRSFDIDNYKLGLKVGGAKRLGNFKYLDDSGTKSNLSDDKVKERLNNQSNKLFVEQNLKYRNTKQSKFHQYLKYYRKEQGIASTGLNQSLFTSYETDRLSAAIAYKDLRWSEMIPDFEILLNAKVERNTFKDPKGFFGQGSYWQENLSFANSLELEAKRFFKKGFQISWFQDFTFKRLEPKNSLGENLFDAINRFRIDQAFGVSADFLSSSFFLEMGTGFSFLRDKVIRSNSNSYNQKNFEPENYFTQSFTALADYSLSSNLALVTNFSSSERIPGFFELFGNNGLFRGKVDLEPESSKKWDFGPEFKLFNERFIVNASYFIEDFRKLIVWQQNSQYTSTPRNFASVKSRGYEFSASLRPIKMMHITANLTSQKVINDSKEIKSNYQKRLPFKPDLKAKIRIQARLLKASFFMESTYTGKRFLDGPNFNELPEKWIYNGGFKFSFKKDLEAGISFFNIFDQRNYDYYGYPLPGSSYLLNLTASI